MASCVKVVSELTLKHAKFAVHTGIPDALKDFSFMVDGQEIKDLLCVARIIFIETMFVLALKLRQDSSKLQGDNKEKALQKARQMIFEQKSAAIQQVDGVSEDMLFQSLYSHVKQEF